MAELPVTDAMFLAMLSSAFSIPYPTPLSVSVKTSNLALMWWWRRRGGAGPAERTRISSDGSNVLRKIVFGVLGAVSDTIVRVG